MKKTIMVFIIFITFLTINVNAKSLKSNITWEDNNNDGIINISDEICISTECFYIYENNDGKIFGMSEWNLEVGYSCTKMDADCHLIENPSGIQNKEVMHNTIKNVYYGVLSWSEEAYWTEDYPMEIDNTLDWGENPIAWSNKSYTYQPIINYQEYINKITKEEIFTIFMPKASDVDKTPNFKFNESYTSDYWTATALNYSYNGGSILYHSSNGSVGENTTNMKYWTDMSCIRPYVLFDEDKIFSYEIYTKTDNNGQITYQKNEDNTVTFKLIPNEGYVLGEVKVTDANNNNITFINYTFTMPSANVTIEATFKKETAVDKVVNKIENPKTGTKENLLLLAFILLLVSGVVSIIFLKKRE